MRVLELRYVPIPYAYKLLSNALSHIERIGGRRGMAYSETIYRTLSYLRDFSKCASDEAMEAVKRLMNEVGLSEFASVMVVNIRPRSIEELRAILGAARVGTTLSDEELERVIKILDETCKTSLEESK